MRPSLTSRAKLIRLEDKLSEIFGRANPVGFRGCFGARHRALTTSIFGRLGFSLDAKEVSLDNLMLSNLLLFHTTFLVHLLEL